MNTRLLALISGVVGMLVPLALLAADAASAHGWWPEWILLVWPSSYMLGATASRLDLGGYLIVGAAIITNGILYAYLGVMLARVIRR